MKIERQTLAQQVLDLLVLRLMASPLKQGERVSTEQELMEEFGVSRSSIREAVKALQNLGILESRPALGTFLSAKKDTYARLLLFASLLSRDNSTDLQKLSQALNFHSLSLLQHDLLQDEDSEKQQLARQHHMQLEKCLDNLTQLRLSAPGSQELLAQQQEFVQLLAAYPNHYSLLGRIGSSLEDFLIEKYNGNVQFSEGLMNSYIELVEAVGRDRGTLLNCHNRQTALLDGQKIDAPEAELAVV